ncbi:S8 family peptidase [Rubrivirga sp. IMCC45206]|uniref:S8 family peptidase n=1 Tax=Rubrivirga sp. IMCC45206 TaxID=3391614 RepID=UPI00398FEF6D
MAHKKNLLFPPKRLEERSRIGRPVKSNKTHLPTDERQEERLGPKFEALQKASLTLSASADGNDPEAVLVFEIADDVKDFPTAIRHTGLNIVQVGENEGRANDDFFPQVQSGDHAGDRVDGYVPERVYLTSSNRESLDQVVALYERWKANEPLGYGKARWADVFSRLRDVRVWGPRDRVLETGLEEDFQHRLDHGVDDLPVEVELFFAPDAGERDEREQKVRQAIEVAGGEVASRCELQQIKYHALLAVLPANRARAILDDLERLRHDGEASDALVQEVGVQFLRPAGQMAAPIRDEADDETPSEPGASAPLESTTTQVEGSPVIAIFDGLPLQNHAWLAGRLIVDVEPDVEETYLVADRNHGTAMASLVVHGDANGETRPLRKPVYVYPILRPDPSGSGREVVPELPVDVIHRAVRRMFEGDDPTAPTVKVINLSVGEEYRPFLGTMSPLARLIDWLSYEYEVLFVVSAGNYREDPTPLGASADVDIFGELTEPESLERALVAESHRDQRNRRILAPAEALNALSVGALSHDYSGDDFAPRTYPGYRTTGLPATYSRRGPGPDRSIKPDVIHSGGRVALHRPYCSDDPRWRVAHASGRPPGHLVASPGAGLQGSAYTAGTSNAAALTSRETESIIDVLQELRATDRGGTLDDAPVALWVKAMLVHSASWPSEAAQLVDEVYQEEGVSKRRVKSALASTFGFGAVQPHRVLASDDHRATLLGAGVMHHDGDDVWDLPLPGSLQGKEGKRRLTITLAWFIPPPLRVRTVRSAKLFFEAPDSKWIIRDARARQADYYGVRKGTVHHEVLEGDKVTLFTGGDSLTVHVKCDDREKKDRVDPLVVPYALVATIEAAPEMEVPVYQEVQAGVRARTKVRA